MPKKELKGLLSPEASLSDTMLLDTYRSKYIITKKPPKEMVSSVSLDGMEQPEDSDDSDDSRSTDTDSRRDAGIMFDSTSDDDYSVVSIADSLDLNVVNRIQFPRASPARNEQFTVVNNQDDSFTQNVNGFIREALNYEEPEDVDVPEENEANNAPVAFNMFPDDNEEDVSFEAILEAFIRSHISSAQDIDENDLRGLTVADFVSYFTRNDVLQQLVTFIQNENFGLHGLDLSDEEEEDYDEDED